MTPGITRDVWHATLVVPSCLGLDVRSRSLAAQIENYVKYPPRQKATSFNLNAVMAQLGPAIQAYAEKKKEAAASKAPVADHGVLVSK
jgi:hypothetical protein